MSETKHQSVAVIERGSIDKMHPVVRAAMEQSPDPETLRELLAVQREWEAGEAKRAFTQALVELKNDMPTVINRDKSVSFGNTSYTHASLAAAMDAVTGPLTLHGFSIAWIPSTGQDGVSVTCRLTHAAGHSEEATLSSPPDEKGSKSRAQAIASTITLLSRYTALALLGIATADMVEPKGDPEPDSVNTSRNMKAVRAVVDAGKTKEAAEKMIGRTVQEWTADDLDKIRAWIKPKASVNPNLKEALDMLARCESKTELDALADGIKGLKLKGDDRKQAGAAYNAKLAEIEKAEGM